MGGCSSAWPPSGAQGEHLCSIAAAVLPKHVSCDSASMAIVHSATGERGDAFDKRG